MRRVWYISKIIFIFLFLVLPPFSRAGFPAQSELSELQKQARIYREQGLAAQKQGDMGQAASFYQKAILLDPKYAAPYNDLGVVLGAKGDLKQAKEMYLKAIQIEPAYPNSYSNLALLYERQGDYTNAIQYWMKRAARGDSNDPWTQMARERLENLTQLYPQAYHKIESQLVNQECPGLIEKEKELQQRIISLECILQNERARLYQELGTAYVQAKLFNLAIGAYAKALDFNPNNAEVHYNLGLLYKHAKDNNAKSIFHLKTYLQLNPDAENKKEVEYLIKILEAK